jgi:hypothetical protein
MSPEGASQNHEAPLMLRTSRDPPIRAIVPGVSLPARSETALTPHPSTGRSPEGTLVVADGRAKRHRRNAVPKPPTPKRGGRGFVARVVSGTPCRGAVRGASFRACRFAQRPATFWDACGIGSSPARGSSFLYRSVSPAASAAPEPGIAERLSPRADSGNPGLPACRGGGDRGAGFLGPARSARRIRASARAWRVPARPHSQIRTILHPAARSARFTSRSRRRLRATFCRQNATREAGSR